MRKLATFALILCVLLNSSGCSLLPSALFEIFGDAYSGGGYTRADREADFFRRADASQSYSPD